MKKALSLIFAFILLISLFSVAIPVSATDDEKVVYVYNWGEYIADGRYSDVNVLKMFEKETGIKVVYETFSDNESMYSMLKGGGVQYDVIIPSDYMIAKLINEDMLEKINYDNIPNFKYIDKDLLNPDYDPENEYSVPYTWGAVGLFYNKKYVKKDVDSWELLWDKDYSGKILMFNNPRDAFAIAQKRLGYSFNSTDEKEWKEAYKLLKEQNPLVQSYVMDEIFDLLASGEAWIAPYYCGDYPMIKSNNEDIEFVFPKEGVNQFVDAMCIPKGGNTEYAEKFIDYMCRTDIAKANVDVIGYCTPQVEAKKLLDKDVVESDILYPKEDVLKNAETFAALPDDISKLEDELWTDIRVGDSGGYTHYYWIFGIIAVVIIAVIIFVTVKKKKSKKYYE